MRVRERKDVSPEPTLARPAHTEYQAACANGNYYASGVTS
jgi:hypothetical protein